MQCPLSTSRWPAAPQAKRRLIKSHRLLTSTEVEQQLAEMEAQRAGKGKGAKKAKAEAKAGKGKAKGKAKGAKGGQAPKGAGAARATLGEVTNAR